jgi:hypothetical protein
MLLALALGATLAAAVGGCLQGTLQHVVAGFAV